MRRILEAFAATSVPTGTFLLLMGMGSMGATPGLDSVKAEAPQELWATLQMPPPIALEIELETPDSIAVQASTAEASTAEASTAEASTAEASTAEAPLGNPDSARTPAASPDPAPEALAATRPRSERSKPFAGIRDGNAVAAPSKLPPKRHQAGVAISHKEPKKKGGSCMDHTDAIVKVSSNKWTVERSFLEALASDRDAASRLAVLTWNNSTNGKVDGFKVRRVRCGSPLHQAGFRNGDVIHGVNGHKVTSIAEAIWTYGQVRRDPQLKVNLTRKDGSAAKLRYTVK